MNKVFIGKYNKACLQLSRVQGYTLIETMIAVSLFLVVAVLGMGSFLNASSLSQKSQDSRSIMDSLSFTMEEMSRNLRTGYNYRCYDSTVPWGQGNAQTAGLNTPRSCTNGGVIVFEESHGRTPTSAVPDANATDQWAYKIESTNGGVSFNVSKSTNGGSTWVQLNPPEVLLDSFSGFAVLGAEAPTGFGTGDAQQPLITIILSGKITYKGVNTPFSLQTAVSQRLLDVYTGP